MYDIPFNRLFLQLSDGIRHVMPSADRKLELTAKASMAQPVSQPAVCCNVLTIRSLQKRNSTKIFWLMMLQPVTFSPTILLVCSLSGLCQQV